MIQHETVTARAMCVPAIENVEKKRNVPNRNISKRGTLGCALREVPMTILFKCMRAHHPAEDLDDTLRVTFVETLSECN